MKNFEKSKEIELMKNRKKVNFGFDLRFDLLFDLI